MRGPNHHNSYGRPRLTGKTNRDPLRKIVGRDENEHGVPLEVLECGHKQPVRNDMIGPTNAYRRRCRRCAAAAPPSSPGAPPT